MGSDVLLSSRKECFTYFNPRSPHGERRGVSPAGKLSSFNFNPRSPHGERQQGRGQMQAGWGFQSTLPAWGATRKQTCSPSSSVYFNPRSPHGERPSHLSFPSFPYHFNPRSPHGERPEIITPRPSLMTFQSTLPAWGATCRHFMRRLSSKFQSTLPAWGATDADTREVRRKQISIHAPRMGSDLGGTK